MFKMILIYNNNNNNNSSIFFIFINELARMCISMCSVGETL